MVVGRSFVWIHFPKTGGHTVSAALRAAAGPGEDITFDGARDLRAHDAVGDRLEGERSFDPRGRVVISGLRRLPWWMLSRVHFEAARPPHRCVSRQMLCRGEYYEQDGSVNLADNHVTRLGSHPVDRWVRLEHLADDFVDHFEDLLGPRVRRAALKLRKVMNPTVLDYVKSLDFYFTPDELAGLYAANPAWAALERQVYGDILRL